MPVTRGSTVHSDFTKVGGVSNIVSLCTIFGATWNVQPRQLDHWAKSRNESGSEFQTAGPATGKARVPKVLQRNYEYSVCDRQ